MISVNGQCLDYQKGTLLETLKRFNTAPNSECESGFCGACRTQLVTGKVEYIQEPIGFVGAGEILPCICKPQGDIEIIHTLI